MADPKVITHVSKQAHFDKDKMLLASNDWGDYELHCLSPQSRWLLTTLLEFYGEFHNRFDNFPTEREVDQLRADTLEGLICPMACQEDFQALVAAVQGIGLTLIDIRDRLGDSEADIDTKIETVATSVDGLTAELTALGLPTLIDKLEPMLNGVGVILGAPHISSNGS